MEPSYPLHIPDLLSESDLERVKLPRGGWCRSVVIDDRGRVRHDRMRTSEQRRLSDRSALLRKILERVRELESTATVPRGLQFHGEASLVRYKVGQAYGQHGDAAGMEGGREWTVLVCLQAASDGGETRFANLGRTYKLSAGEALIWPNYDARGRENEAMDHEALPVTGGCKVVANVWLDL